MRAATRLFTAVKQAEFLEAGAPTGLTGLLTHPSPRSTLVYLYSSTLDKLQQIPESSVYRQATEALTKHRLAIIQAAKPRGYEAWQQRVQLQVQENPKHFELVETSNGTRIRLKSTKTYVDFRLADSEWDGERKRSMVEGIKTAKQRSGLRHMHGGKDYDPLDNVRDITIDPEPPLTAEQ
jgi:NADH dehydrogenase (ubiquinone) 1 alpha subcomplex subunit 5